MHRVSISGVPGIDARPPLPLHAALFAWRTSKMRACRVTVLWVHRSRLCNVRPRVRMVQAPRRSARGARVAGRERHDISRRAGRAQNPRFRARTRVRALPSLSLSLSSSPRAPSAAPSRFASGFFCRCALRREADPRFPDSFSTSWIDYSVSREVEEQSRGAPSNVRVKIRIIEWSYRMIKNLWWNFFRHAEESERSWGSSWIREYDKFLMSSKFFSDSRILWRKNFRKKKKERDEITR